MTPTALVPTIGIDDLSAYIPAIYLPIRTLAEARGIEYAKLNKGLGLTAMAVADATEDTATMAANAVLDLIYKNDLEPQQIGRIYLGTETALDGAKPTATYVLEMLQDQLSELHGPNCLLHCDVVDMTFACIGAVDALQNTLDWVAAGENRIGIVVASDNAKYELGSTGEYTQGAGAVAVLVKRHPRLLVIDSNFGVATRPVHDFYKPLRSVSKASLIDEVLALLPNFDPAMIDKEAILAQLNTGITVEGILDCNERELQLYKTTPVFDGPYSNDCYQARIREALHDYRRRHGLAPGHLLRDWESLIFHLPYAYQARRMFAEIFAEELKATGQWHDFVASNQLTAPCADQFEDRDTYMLECADFLRQLTKTAAYQNFVAQKIAAGEQASSLVGNLYAGSIFLSLMSSLEVAAQAGQDLAGKQLGFFAYGSGSKSKVFAAQVQPGWEQVVADFQLLERLAQRSPITYEAYERLHRGSQLSNVGQQEDGTFFLADVHTEKDDTLGARHYGYRCVHSKEMA